MIQFNLLPDVKLEYIKAQRAKHLVLSVSLLLSAASIAVFVLLILSVDVLQKKNISDLSADIQTYSKQLKGQDNLDKILTVQNQLNALTGLHDQKATASRVPGFISQVTPTAATISELNLDFAANKMTITGKAANLDVINTFVDSLKFTQYVTETQTTPINAFSSVILSSFGRTNNGATYTIDLNFDPVIFKNTSDVSLVVPNIITTRSVTEHPSAVFQGTN
jgi:hypothetical protein